MNRFTFKSLKNKTIVGLVLIQSAWAQAYLPEIPFILKKASSTTGRKIIQIEQEVTFKVGEEESKVDETWLIEGDKNLKLVAIGKNLFKDSLRLNYLYNGKNKTFLSGKNKNVSTVSHDFFQRYLFIRSQGSFVGYLKDLNIPAHDQSTVKLSRADGVISYLIGQPSEQNLNSQIWIGQDDFVVRKIRTPSAAEITLGQITSFPNDIFIAKAQTITWQNSQPVTVQIRIKRIDVNAGGSLSAFYPQNLDLPSEMAFSNKTPLTAVMEEFYSRFR